MAAVSRVRELARRDVAALEPSRVSPIRLLRDLALADLVRHARRPIRRAMREAGQLRPWWDRSPLLLLVAPLAAAVALVLGAPLVALVGALALGVGVTTEPRLSRAERAQLRILMAEYRHAAADALDARGDAKARDAERDVRDLWEPPEAG